LKPGNAYFKFRKDRRYLLVNGSDTYYHVSLGVDGARTADVSLYDDVYNFQDDDVVSGTRPPVVRFLSGMPLMILAIAIRAHH
jgi:hypothetical protein